MNIISRIEKIEKEFRVHVISTRQRIMFFFVVFYFFRTSCFALYRSSYREEINEHDGMIMYDVPL